MQQGARLEALQQRLAFLQQTQNDKVRSWAAPASMLLPAFNGILVSHILSRHCLAAVTCLLRGIVVSITLLSVTWFCDSSVRRSPSSMANPAVVFIMHTPRHTGAPDSSPRARSWFLMYPHDPSVLGIQLGI